MRSLRNRSAAAAALALLTFACGGRTVRTTVSDPGAVDIAMLWQEPADLESRDLFLGAGGSAVAPDPRAQYTFIEADRTGFSPGYDLKDPRGVTWSVKLGPEAQTEVVASRILWAIGYHQVPTYYLTDWAMQGGPEGDPGPGRFRPELPTHKVVGEWAWNENPFVNTQPFRGLIVANLIINNWDWKESNNRIYEITHDGGQVERRYMVRDLGASFGKTSSPALFEVLGSRIAQGNRNNLEDFEKQGFITSVNGEELEFDYDGIYGHVVDTVRVADVVWTCRLLSRLSDRQWTDAFRAAGYAPDQAARFIAKLKTKIAEGLALASARASAPPAGGVEGVEAVSR